MSGVGLSYLLSPGGARTVGVVLLQPRPRGLLPALQKEREGLRGVPRAGLSV